MNTFVPVAKMLTQQGTVRAVVLYVCELCEIRVQELAEPVSAAIKNYELFQDVRVDFTRLATYGVKDNLIMIVGREGDEYRFYLNSQEGKLGALGIYALLQSGCRLGNAKLVNSASKDMKNMRISLLRGDIYDFKAPKQPSTGVQRYQQTQPLPNKADFFVVKADVAIDGTDSSEVYYYRNMGQAKVGFERLVVKHSPTASRRGWYQNKNADTYSSWSQGAYSDEHIIITIRPAAFEN